jgi:dipeptidyl aminopeptidase/acylaminoacyl peptidase
MLNGARWKWLFAALVVAAGAACSGASHSNVATPTPTADAFANDTGYAARAAPPGAGIVRAGYKTLAVDLTSGDVRELVTAPSTVEAYHSRILFVESPDGTRLAYTCGSGVAATPTAVAGGSGHVTGDLCIWTAKGALTPPVAVAADLPNPGLLSPDAWSPDGSKLVVRDQLLIGPAEPPVQSYLLDLKTLRATRLLGGMQVSHAAWSPDSRRVAFANAAGLFVVDLESGTSVNVAAAPLAEAPDYGVGELAWSPNGSSIAFTLTAAGHLASAMYVASADDASVRKIGTGGKDLRWSPDGQWIARAIDPRAIGSAGASGCGISRPCFELHVVRADGSEDRAVAEGMIDAGAPAWSPDSTRLAFRGLSSTQFASDGYERVFVTDAVGGGSPRQIGGDVRATAAPNITWSDDGKHVFFIGYPPEVGPYVCGRGGCADGDLFMTDASGSGTPRQLYPDAVQKIRRG